MPFKTHFWVTTFNLAIAGLAGFFVCVVLLRGGPITCGHHWENDLMLVSALALATSAGTALLASFGSACLAQIIWRKAQWTLAWVCYGLASWAMIALLQDGVAFGFRHPSWENAASLIGVATISGFCAKQTRRYIP